MIGVILYIQINAKDSVFSDYISVPLLVSINLCYLIKVIFDREIIMLKILILFTLATLTSLPVTAGLIQYNGYERETDSQIVKGKKLEWLKWDVTRGQSVNTALADYSSQGWQVANIVQVIELFSDFKFGFVNLNDAINGKNFIKTQPWTASEETPHYYFTQLFGISEGGTTCIEYIKYHCHPMSDPWYWSIALYLNLEKTGVQGASIYDDFTYKTNELTAIYGAYAELNNGEPADFNFRGYSSGIALVRENGVPPTNQIPEPSSNKILILTLAIIAFRRSLKIKASN